MRASPTGIILAVCEQMGVSGEEFAGTGRMPKVLATRWIAAALLRKHTTLSYPEIAYAMRRVNKRTDRGSHASSLCACRYFRTHMCADGSLKIGNVLVPGCRQVFEAVERELEGVTNAA